MSAPSSRDQGPGKYEIEACPSGNLVDLLLPRPEAIALEDVALHLSNICRFAGGVLRFYSVAEHASLCAAKARAAGAPVPVQLGVLHHDDPEAYLQDQTRPLKLLLRELSAGADHDLTWDGLEEGMERAVHAALGEGLWHVEDQSGSTCVACDNWALLAEAKELKPSRGEHWRLRAAEWGLSSVALDEWPPGFVTDAMEWAPHRLGLDPRRARTVYLQTHHRLVRELAGE